MATIRQAEAVELLSHSVKTAHSDDLVEIYNELFPEEPTTENVANSNPVLLIDEIVAHIERGLEIEEIVDLWNVIFPTHHGVWFDENEGLMHYDESVEQVDLVN